MIDDLHSTFSSSHCHTCLERMSDAALLLDSEMRVLFMSPSFRSMVQTPDELFVLAPKFGLRDPADARRLAELLSAPSQDNEKPCLMLHEGGSPIPLLLTVFRLPKPKTPDLGNVASFLILLRDSSRFPQQQWQLFIDQFQLTSAEARLCRALADGLTLSGYCEQWRVTANTARSQLKDIFAKTSTRRQVDLTRLIFLFTRG
ncbi:helix-turn-helix transcriptional regulator [Methylogaea oryzae]|uniref:helix-turn-helix transcriptional regulator n=1 Tax=Methylogaea oryzae TaxID=1295382 RepID=UPI0012E21260|nr:hypothetical protein [Methylogaea oryzae]